MNNLITTIIGIALTALLLLAGAYYGGQAYQNAQINAVANSIMNEAQQILYAERMWSTNNNQPDISGMGASGASGTGMSALVNGKELSEWPSFGGTIGYSRSLTNPGPQPWLGWGTAATVTTGTDDLGCYSISAYTGLFFRYVLSLSNQNYVVYEFNSGTCSSTTYNFENSGTDTSQINHPIVLIAKAINAAMNQIPVGSTMQALGLPYSSGVHLSSNYSYDGSNNQAQWLYTGSSQTNTISSNFCELLDTYQIVCIFGPS